MSHDITDIIHSGETMSVKKEVKMPVQGSLCHLNTPLCSHVVFCHCCIIILLCCVTLKHWLTHEGVIFPLRVVVDAEKVTPVCICAG